MEKICTDHFISVIIEISDHENRWFPFIHITIITSSIFSYFWLFLVIFCQEFSEIANLSFNISNMKFVRSEFIICLQ